MNKAGPVNHPIEIHIIHCYRNPNRQQNGQIKLDYLIGENLVEINSFIQND